MISKFTRTFLLIITVILASLACNLPNNTSPKQATAVPKATVNTDQILNQAVKVDPNSNKVTITLTESQINGMINTELQKMSSSSNSQIPISEPSVTLKEGIITVNGKVSSGVISSQLSISFKPSVTSDHKIKFEIAKSDFGMLPVPNDFTQTIADQFSTSVNQSLSDSNGQILIDTVTISDGKLVVVAHR
jgi:uncharacterized protein YpmS